MNVVIFRLSSDRGIFQYPEFASSFQNTLAIWSNPMVLRKQMYRCILLQCVDLRARVGQLEVLRIGCQLSSETGYAESVEIPWFFFETSRDNVYEANTPLLLQNSRVPFTKVWRIVFSSSKSKDEQRLPWCNYTKKGRATKLQELIMRIFSARLYRNRFSITPSSCTRNRPVLGHP